MLDPDPNFPQPGIAAWLGHSTIQITADRYGHLFLSLEEDLTIRLGRTYQSAVDDAR